MNSLVISRREGILIASSPSSFLPERVHWAQHDKGGYNEHFQRMETKESFQRHFPR